MGTGGEGASAAAAMSDDDVEMEFVSVMGVLVPMEVTKGVSEEAWRFVRSSGDETVDNSEANLEVRKPKNRKKKRQKGQENDEPTKPIYVKSKINVKQAKRKANLDAKTAEKQATATTKKKTTGVESNVHPEVAVPEEKERDPTGDRLSRDTRENLRSSRKQSTEVKAKPDLSSPAVESKQAQKQSCSKARPAKKQSIEAESKSDTEWIARVQTVNRKERPSNGKFQSNSAERGGRTQACKPRTTKTKKMRARTGAKTHCESPPVDNQSKKAKRRVRGAKWSAEAAPKVVRGGSSQIDDQGIELTSYRAHTSNDDSPVPKPPATTGALSTVVAAKVSAATRKGKSSHKRRRRSDQEVVARSDLTNQLNTSESTARSRITETWKLESDDDEQEKKKLKNSKLKASTGAKTSSTAMETNERRSSRGQGICAYPDCTQPVKYRSRCAKHNSRSRCSMPDCTKFAHSGGHCIAHGGGSRCTKDGCDRRARSQGNCYAHGGGVLCSHPKCSTRAKSKGRCIAHGGGTVCSATGCDKLVTANGKCIAHGGWTNCSHPGCDKRVQLRGKCMEHRADETTGGENPTMQFRRATTKPAEMNTPSSDARPSRSIEMEKLFSGTVMDSKGNRERQEAVKTAKTEAVSKGLEESTMALRSGQRIKLVAQSVRSGHGEFQTEEDALQMALKLSKIEY